MQIAICMPTFNPDLDLFSRQVASIIAQTHDDWLCIIADDGSEPPIQEAMRGIVSADPRFRFLPIEKNVGILRNCEQALRHVPAAAEFVALADQDDIWYPNKLATLAQALSGGQALAYSDMRVVDATGATISESFWMNRPNNWSSLETMLLGNTVTGASLMFRRTLLDVLLPFPKGPPIPVHDQWIATAALVSGGIVYVDEPLYDYVQHPTNQLGFRAQLRFRQVRRSLNPARLLFNGESREEVRRLLEGARLYHEHKVVWGARMAGTLLDRLDGRLEPGHRRVLERWRAIENAKAYPAWLALRGSMNMIRETSTQGSELIVLIGLAWGRLQKWRRTVHSSSPAVDIAGSRLP